MTSWAPRARATGLVESAVADDVILYDTSADRVHCLNPSAAALWRCCDGERTPSKLANLLGVDDVEVVWHGLRQLGEQGLLETPMPDPGDKAVSRRDALRKIVIGGAIGFAIPTVISIVAPEAASAASCRKAGESCTGLLDQGTCCPGLICAVALVCIEL